VRSEAYAQALVALAVKTFGRLDIAFNNAGTLGEGGPSTAVSEAGWNDAIAINLTGSFLGAKHQIAEMVKHGGGSVIFTSTFVGYSSSFPGVAAYAASKSGLIGLTQTLAAEFGPQNVRVNAILPGAIETDMYREMNDTPDKTAFITNLHALSASDGLKKSRGRCSIWRPTTPPSSPGPRRWSMAAFPSPAPERFARHRSRRLTWDCSSTANGATSGTTPSRHSGASCARTRRSATGSRPTAAPVRAAWAGSRLQLAATISTSALPVHGRTAR
jgi:NAD(P)-dependent dehydrogenase (short-subunit alcohol dehydrogenase family)